MSSCNLLLLYVATVIVTCVHIRVAAQQTSALVGVCSAAMRCSLVESAMQQHIAGTPQEYRILFVDNTDSTAAFFAFFDALGSDVRVTTLISDLPTIGVVASVASVINVPFYLFAPGAVFLDTDLEIRRLSAAVTASPLFIGGLAPHYTDVAMPMGALAAALSASGHIGVVLGRPTQRAKELLNGFLAGANNECPSCQVLAKYFEFVDASPPSKGVTLDVEAISAEFAGPMRNIDVALVDSHNQSDVDRLSAALATVVGSNRSAPVLICAQCPAAETLVRITIPRFLAQSGGVVEMGGLAQRVLDAQLACAEPCLDPRSRRVFTDLRLRIVSGTLDESYKTRAQTLFTGSGALQRLQRVDAVGFVPQNIAWGNAPVASNVAYLTMQEDQHELGSTDCMVVAALANATSLSADEISLDVIVMGCFTMIALTPPLVYHYPPTTRRSAVEGFSLNAIARNAFVIFGGFRDAEKLTPVTEMAFLYFKHPLASEVMLVHLTAANITSVLIPEARATHAAASFGTRLFVHGGTGVGARVLSDLWVAEITVNQAEAAKARGLAPPSISVSWRRLHDAVAELRLHTMTAINDGSGDGSSGPVLLALVGGLLINQPQEAVITVEVGEADGASVVHRHDGLLERPALPLSPCVVAYPNSTLLSINTAGAPCLLELVRGAWHCRSNTSTAGGHVIEPSPSGYMCAAVGPRSQNALFVSRRSTVVVDTVDTAPPLPADGLPTFFVYKEPPLSCADVTVALESNVALSSDRLECVTCPQGYFTVVDRCLQCGSNHSAAASPSLAQAIRQSAQTFCPSTSAKAHLSTTIIALLAASAFFAGLCVALIFWLVKHRRPNDQNVANAPRTAPLAITFVCIADTHVHWRNNASDFHSVLEHFNLLLSHSVAKFNGYNVKTVGEAAMIATTTVDQALRIVRHVTMSMRKTRWPSTMGRTLELRVGMDFCSPTIVNTEVAGYDYGGPQALVAALLCKAVPPGYVAISDAARAVADVSFDLQRIAQHQPECRGHPFSQVTLVELVDFDTKAPLGNASISSSSGGAGSPRGGNSPPSRSPGHSRSHSTQLQTEEAVPMEELERVVTRSANGDDERRAMDFIDEQSCGGAVSAEELQVLKAIIVDILRSLLTTLREDQGYFTQLLQKRFAVVPDRTRPQGRRGKALSLTGLNILAGRVLQAMDPAALKTAVRLAYDEGESTNLLVAPLQSKTTPSASSNSGSKSQGVQVFVQMDTSAGNDARSASRISVALPASSD